MPEFQYTGTNQQGERSSGEINANDRKTAIRLLQQKGISPIKLNERKDTKLSKTKSKKGSFAGQFLKDFGKTNQRDATIKNKNLAGNQLLGLKLARRLLELHSGGMSLGDSVYLLSQRLSEKKLKAITSEIWTHLREGKSFAKATKTIPNLFPPAMFPLFEAGEASGDMVAILKNTIEFIEERKALKKKMLSSLSYPFFLMFMVILMMAGFLGFLVPKIQMMVQSMGGELNFFTQSLIQFSEWLFVFGPFILVGLIVLYVVLWQWRKTEVGRLKTDQWMLALPLIGSIIEASSLYQLSNLMTTLMDSGINTSENLKLSERTIQNRWIKSRFSEARSMIIEGASFSNAFKQHQLYPESSIDILTVGENTGKLERGLREITGSVRSILDDKLKFLTICVSSGAMAFAFLMVVFAALGMVMSVLEVSQTISLQ